MAKDVDQVLVGVAQVYYAPLATAFPANAETAPAGTWIDIGYTDEGWAFEWEQTFENIEVAEEAEPIDTRWTAIEYRAVAALAQVSLEHFKTVLNGGTITAIPGPPVRRTYTPPALGADVAIALLIRFVNENDPFHTDLQLPKVRSVGQVSLPFRKAPEKSVMATTFQVAKPSSGSIWTLDEYVSLT